MEEYVKELVDRGYAYETSKGVYFDTSKLENYGRYLSPNNIDGLLAGARIEVDSEKKNPLDFALWIKAPKEHIMQWDSSFGKCYPGWHIECSAMSRKYLGEEFDIHTGGVDHIQIHHENEIAQSVGATGKILARYWLHTEFLLVDGGKMSKSLGNVYTLAQLQEKNIEPLAFRYFTYSSNFTNKLNFTWEAIKSSQVSLNKLREQVNKNKGVNTKLSEEKIKKYEERFLDAINDNLNMPIAISVLWDLLKEEKSNDVYELAMKFDTVLSLELNKKMEEKEIPIAVQELLRKREEARKEKNFALSDELRKKILNLGYLVKDTKEGQKVEKSEK